MRYPRLVLLSSSLCAASLVLSGCGGTPIVNSSSAAPGTGPAPTVIAVGEQVNGVAPNRKQEVQFSEAMDPATINAQSFQVTDSSGKPVPGIVSYDPDFETASFLPSPALQMSAGYAGTITPAAASSGEVHLADPYTYTFTTRDYSDTSPISVNSVSPTPNATCVSATAPIIITFDEAPDASTVNSSDIVVTGPNGAVIPVTTSINVTTTQVVITPTSPLPSGTITVTVNNVGDLADVLMTSPYTWTFSTACGGGNGGGTSTQYIAPLFGNGTSFGQVSVDTTGNVTVQLKGAAVSQAFAVEFCIPFIPPATSNDCFSVGTVNTDASGNGSMTVMFPKSGAWAGDFELFPNSGSSSGSNPAYFTEYGPGYMSTLVPNSSSGPTVDGNLLSNRAPLTSGTVTYSSSPTPLGSLTFTLTGAPPNVIIEADEGSLVLEQYYGIGGTYTTDSAGDVTFTVPPSGHGGDMFDVSPQNGQLGWSGGFSVP